MTLGYYARKAYQGHPRSGHHPRLHSRHAGQLGEQAHFSTCLIVQHTLAYLWHHLHHMKLVAMQQHPAVLGCSDQLMIEAFYPRDWQGFGKPPGYW